MNKEVLMTREEVDRAMRLVVDSAWTEAQANAAGKLLSDPATEGIRSTPAQACGLFLEACAVELTVIAGLLKKTGT